MVMKTLQHVSFARSLRILSVNNVIDWSSGITDVGLRACKSIEQLYMYKNNGIATCAPFAKSLRVLMIHQENSNIIIHNSQYINLKRIEYNDNVNILTKPMKLVI